MSSTRTSSTPGEFNQERFASDAAFDQGLLGNLVAKRVAILEDSRDREVILYIQACSRQPRGLAQLVEKLLRDYKSRLGTRSVCALREMRQNVCESADIRRIGDDVPYYCREDLPLPAGIPRELLFARARFCGSTGSRAPLSDFVEWCAEIAQERLPKDLFELCLNPSFRFDRGTHESIPSENPHIWYFHDLRGCLLDLIHKNTASVEGAMVRTDVSRRIWDCLNYSLDQKCMVMIEGLSRLGKTFAAKTWCDARPGTVRYVQVPSEGDDLAFYREMARALGVGCGLSMKAQQIRERVKQTILQAGFMVVFDEAHYLWPQTIRSESLPVRLNWVLTTLVNNGIAVGLITTPQFYARKQLLEKKTGWASEQFDGRLAHYEKLPEALSESDLRSVAERHLPEGNKDMIEAVIGFARISSKYLSGIADTVKRARYIASRAGRGRVVAGDLIKAIEENGLPSVFRSASRMESAPATPVERSNSLRGGAAAPKLATTVRVGGNRSFVNELAPLSQDGRRES